MYMGHQERNKFVLISDWQNYLSNSTEIIKKLTQSFCSLWPPLKIATPTVLDRLL